MGKVIMLCGKVASGKTTYAQALKARGGILLSCDEIMLTLFDECLGDKHNEIVERCKEYLFPLAENIADVDGVAVLDFGLWTKDERKESAEYFKTRNIPCELHYVKCPDNLRKERLKLRNEQLKSSTRRREYIISDEMLELFDSRFEEPTTDEIDVLFEN